MGITNHLIKEKIASLTEVRNEAGVLEDAYIRVCAMERWHTLESHVNLSQVDRVAVLERGREAVGKILIDLQVRKSTADGPGATEFYTDLTNPIAGWDGELRDLILQKKQVCPALE